MRSITLSFALQTADDGNTTHFGGSFTVDELNNPNEFYFHGNDRGTSVADIIFETLLEHWDVDIGDEEDNPNYDHIHHNMDMAAYDSTPIRLLIDDDNMITTIEPIT